MSVKMTPMMQQYMDCKERYPDAILFFRLGDFYEMFFEDAEVVSRELGLTLTSRSKGDNVPMAGVPYHSHQGYVAQLIDKGFTVAVAEQLEDPSSAKGVVKRDVVKVITPGVVMDTDNLEAKAPNYVCAIDTVGGGFGMGFGVAYMDVSTGDFRATEVATLNDLVSELHRVEAREVLAPEYAQELLAEIEPHLEKSFLRYKHRAYFDPDGLLRAVSKGPRLQGDIENDSYFLDRRGVEAVLSGAKRLEFQAPELVGSAAAAVLRYIVKTQRGIPSHVRAIEPYRANSFLVIDESTKANLELTETLMGGRRAGSLLSIIDETVTAMGGRRLRQWLNYPLVDAVGVEARLDAVEELVKYPALREDVRKALDEVYDIERLCGRLSGGTANARDLRSLLSTLEVIPQIKDILEDCGADLLIALNDDLDPCEEICALIDRAVVENPPAGLTDGGLFKMGYHDELDEILDLAYNGKDWMINYEVRQREETGISSLKVKYNKVFDYFIEVTKANLDRVPDHYIRKQTLSNSERYFTDELKEMEDKILNAEERRKDLEYQLFEELRQTIGADISRLMKTASELANLDVIAGLAQLAVRREYCRPEITTDDTIEIEQGRHPVVETTMKDGERFVPNDLEMREARRLGIITGPNMAGKSTVIRQVALLSLLAQMGSFVPAKRAKLGVVDKIFSRVGASDNLARGQSTFMVEMTETAHILNNATPRSLIILDEIGRGTATYDGLSIAWAVAEHLHNAIGAKTLFATHYHELTDLADELEGAFNMSIAVKEWKDDIIFLRKLVDGPANRSYGIQVGRLAGLPNDVVQRAKGILELLEAGHFEQLEVVGERKDIDALARERARAEAARQELDRPPAQAEREQAPASTMADHVRPSRPTTPAPEPTPEPTPELASAPTPEPTPEPAMSAGQLSLFGGSRSKEEEQALEELRQVSIGHMTPIEALVLLDRLSRSVQGKN